MHSIYFIVFLSGFIYQSEPKTKKLKLPLWAILADNSRIDENGFRIWEKDIVFHGMKKEDDLFGKTARKDLLSRWPLGIIPYKIGPSYHKDSKSAIMEAMQLWMDNTCVKFSYSPTISRRPHLVIKHTGSGCNSWVGIYEPTTIVQTLSLDYPDCATSVPVVTHELGHAIGLWHEQDRADRDTHLKVYKKNMGKNKVLFEVGKDDVINYDVPYDYSSIMQYTPDTFSSNGKLILVPKDPMAFPLMGNSKTITHLDYKLVNRMYNCSVKCQPRLSCQNGGYNAWNIKKGCRCECPPGFNGSKCETKVDVAPRCGGKITTPTRFQSPNYPQNHPADMQCAWLIEPPRGKLLSLFFHDFNLMKRSGKENKCFWSGLRIRNGDLLSDDPGTIHCDNELHQKTVAGKGDHTLLILTSSYNQAKGLDVSVNFV